MQYVLVDGLTGMGIARLALPLSFFRKTVYISLVVWLSVKLGAATMFWAEPVSDVVSPIVSTIVFLTTIPKLLRKRGMQVERQQ